MTFQNQFMTSCKGILSHINETNGTLIILFELFILYEQEEKTIATTTAPATNQQQQSNNDTLQDELKLRCHRLFLRQKLQHNCI